MSTEPSLQPEQVVVSRAEFEALKDQVTILKAASVEAIKVVPLEVIKKDSEATQLALESKERLDHRGPLIAMGISGFVMTVILVVSIGASAFTVHTKNEDSDYTYTISGSAAVTAFFGGVTFLASLGFDQEEKRVGLFHHILGSIKHPKK